MVSPSAIRCVTTRRYSPREQVEGGDQERAGAAGGIDDAKAAQRGGVVAPEGALGLLLAARQRSDRRCSGTSLPCAVNSALKRSDERRPDRPLDKKAGDDVGRIDDALAFALGDFRRRFAAAFGAQFFQIGDRLLENVAEHRHRDFAPVVPVRQACELLGQLVRQYHRVGDRVGRKQSAIIGPDAAAFVANVDFIEKRLKILPVRLGSELVAGVRRSFQKLIRQQFGALGEGNE